MRIEIDPILDDLVPERQEYSTKFPRCEEINSILFRITSNITNHESIKQNNEIGE